MNQIVNNQSLITSSYFLLKKKPSMMLVPLFLYISCFLISDVGVLFVLRPRNFFDEGCDASVPLDDSNGYKNHSIPNHTLRGVDKVDFIKEELEKAWPGCTFMC